MGTAVRVLMVTLVNTWCLLVGLIPMSFIFHNSFDGWLSMFMLAVVFAWPSLILAAIYTVNIYKK